MPWMSNTAIDRSFKFNPIYDVNQKSDSPTIVVKPTQVVPSGSSSATNVSSIPIENASPVDGNSYAEFFPLYNIMLGKTTYSEAEAMGYKVEGGSIEINDLDFRCNNKEKIFKEIYFSRFDAMPEKWLRLGFDWQLPYNEWLALFQKKGFTIKHLQLPTTERYNKRRALRAEFVATSPDNSFELKLYFAYGNEREEGWKTDSKNSLFSITTKLLQLPSVMPPTTKLYVTTSPSGAMVYLDDIKIGTTPIEGKEILRGIHQVKICKEEYADKTFTQTFGNNPVILNEVWNDKIKPQTVFSITSTSSDKTTYTVNDVSFTMVKVAGGTFTMGSPDSDSEASKDEKPAHPVTLSSFSIGETEVTQALWQAVMGRNPSKFTGNLQYPVENVSWYDCQEFIRKLNSITGITFRLPTEAEWEYAARGGSQSRGYKYSGSNTLDDVAWYKDNSSSTPQPVKAKWRNELGLYDMSGNVWEWCADWEGYTYYASSPQSNPKGPSSGDYRVCRGGSWCFARGFRVAERHSYSPSWRNDTGLRLVQQF